MNEQEEEERANQELRSLSMKILESEEDDKKASRIILTEMNKRFPKIKFRKSGKIRYSNLNGKKRRIDLVDFIRKPEKRTSKFDIMKFLREKKKKEFLNLKNRDF